MRLAIKKTVRERLKARMGWGVATTRYTDFLQKTKQGKQTLFEKTRMRGGAIKKNCENGLTTISEPN